jgi:REP element-mobilizing transposase RayT
MPDHFHGLVTGLTAASNLRQLVPRWKQVTGYWWRRQGHAGTLWQRGYFDRVLREDDDNESVIRYILMNPVRAGLVVDARDYPFMGASKYDTTTLVESAWFWTPPWKNGRA